MISRSTRRRGARAHPPRGVSAQLLKESPERPGTLLVGLNDRDPKWHDVWRVDIASGERALVLENTGELWSLSFDWQLNPRIGRKSTRGIGSRLHRLVDGRAEPWLDIPFADEWTTWPIMFDRAGHALTMMSSLGRNRAALVRIDMDTGAETVLAEHDKADIGDRRLWNPQTFAIDAVGAIYLRRDWIALDPAVAGDLGLLEKNLGGPDFAVESQSADNTRWVVNAYGAERPLTYFSTTAGAAQCASSSAAGRARRATARAPCRATSSRRATARPRLLPDPAGRRAGGPPRAPLPMVLIVHGGPWGRDIYSYRGDHQWLANRGYAVLSVNYRASTGFGKDFCPCRRASMPARCTTT